MKTNQETIDNAPQYAHASRAETWYYIMHGTDELDADIARADELTHNAGRIPETMLMLLDSVPRLDALVASYRHAAAEDSVDMMQLVGCALSDTASCGSTLPDAGFTPIQMWHFLGIHVRG